MLHLACVIGLPNKQCQHMSLKFDACFWQCHFLFFIRIFEVLRSHMNVETMTMLSLGGNDRVCEPAQCGEGLHLCRHDGHPHGGSRRHPSFEEVEGENTVHVEV